MAVMLDEPVCAGGCASEMDALPTVEFNLSCPEVNEGQITKIYLGLRGQSFTDFSLATEWTERLGTPADLNKKIVALTVIGDKPKPAANSIEISAGRKVELPKDHSVNFTIDETNETNHEFLRKLECGGNFSAWYETAGGLLFGGNKGLPVFIEAGMVIPRERGALIVYEGTMGWKAKYTEARCVSPIA